MAAAWAKVSQGMATTPGVGVRATSTTGARSIGDSAAQEGMEATISGRGRAARVALAIGDLAEAVEAARAGLSSIKAEEAAEEAVSWS